MRTRPSTFLLAVACLAPVGASFAAPQGTTRVVTSTADSGPGSLREALANAVEDDTVDARGIAGTILLTSGPLQLSASATVLGPGPAVLSVSGGSTTHVLEISSGEATVRGFTITGGSSTGNGGGIRIGSPAGSEIVLEDCAIRSNLTIEHGGGIYNASGVSLVIQGCLLAENSAARSGGGIFNDNGTVLIAESTIRTNTADLGGGIFNASGATAGIAQLLRSTCNDNSANYGGAIYSRGASPGVATVIVESCTFSGNSAGDGSAIASDGAWSGNAELEINACTFRGSPSAGGVIANEGRFGGRAELEIANSIFSIDAPGASFVNRDGDVTSLGFNLSSEGGSGLLNHATDQINTDPLLGPLEDHGGPTFTHALLPGSPAIDAGNRSAFGTALEEDQRGLPRVFDDPADPNAVGSDGSDIGAFEVSPSAEVSKLKAKLGFAKANTDSCSFTAALDLGSSFEPAGQQIYLEVAGAKVRILLDEKGRGATERGELPSGRVKLGFQKRTGLWTLTVNLKQGSWYGPWSTRGLVDDDVPKPGHTVMLPVIVRLGDRGWVSEVSLVYTAKAGKSGSAK